jgi:hypothetical protein
MQISCQKLAQTKYLSDTLQCIEIAAFFSFQKERKSFSPEEGKRSG